MQHDDDGTRYGSFGLNRTQRSPRQEDRTAGRHADEVSGCKRAPQREAHRASFNPEFEITAESLVGLLPDASLLGVNVDDVCKQTLFLANLVSSPYVHIH